MSSYVNDFQILKNSHERNVSYVFVVLFAVYISQFVRIFVDKMPERGDVCTKIGMDKLN